ncbi:unnamed protein product [Symbiodinium pilosum]|uniref:Uncharacterized protein n=1 Tax=Symbiodinium pilosum TaxID=2952 RepID=A0A812K315_SYMPI|nr:unnamed protein product [Symbiodinium pilosum]
MPEHMLSWHSSLRRCTAFKLLSILQGMTMGWTETVVNVRAPIIASTTLQKANTTARILIRAGDSTTALAEATCRHLHAVGAGGCLPTELIDIEDTFQDLQQQIP